MGERFDVVVICFKLPITIADRLSGLPGAVVSSFNAPGDDKHLERELRCRVY